MRQEIGVSFLTISSSSLPFRASLMRCCKRLNQPPERLEEVLTGGCSISGSIRIAMVSLPFIITQQALIDYSYPLHVFHIRAQYALQEMAHPNDCAEVCGYDLPASANRYRHGCDPTRVRSV